MTKHLYIHIPFCKSICSYCDFIRFKVNHNDSCISTYIEKIIKQIKDESSPNQYTTIYVGGGTPNMLPDDILENLLSFLSKYINYDNTFEFCIELNPEFITKTQVEILSKNNINRVSIGVQTTNNDILKKLNRKHNIEDVFRGIELLYSFDILNISCDFIYALPELTLKDIQESIMFIDQYQIHHVSFYSLEVKENSILNFENYIIDEDEEADQLEYIDKNLWEIGLSRYEVSNWSKDFETQSIHNKAYWLTKDWKAIGLSGSGFENKTLYKYEGNLQKFTKNEEKLTTADYYLQVLMMGLRLVDGIDVINDKRNSDAYAMYFNEIVNCRIKNNNLQCINLNLLHETLVNIVDCTKITQLEKSKNNN